VHKNKRKKDNDEHQLIIIFSRCIETKEKKTTSVGSLSSFLGAQKQNKKDNDKETTHYRLLWVHKNKRKKDDDKCQPVVVFFRWIKTKETKR
jgi:hypothetical protein